MRPDGSHRWLPILLAAGIMPWGQADAAEPPKTHEESPQVQALLEQGWAAEAGRGLQRNSFLAAQLYRQAGQMGSGEGYYRAALAYMAFRPEAVPRGVAACLLATASQLGHQGAVAVLDRIRTDAERETAACDDDEGVPRFAGHFDLDRYIGGLPQRKQSIVGLIRKLAPLYAVDVRLALAVASVESNFNNLALSPKQAMGVMQLIPATAERFNVRQPFDAEQNIRGGLAYLRWLSRYFDGDVIRMVAAYNAGEKAVDTYGGIPPYRETQAYVARVLDFSGFSFNDLPPTGAGRIASRLQRAPKIQRVAVQTP